MRIAAMHPNHGAPRTGTWIMDAPWGTSVASNIPSGAYMVWAMRCHGVFTFSVIAHTVSGQLRNVGQCVWVAGNMDGKPLPTSA